MRVIGFPKHTGGKNLGDEPGSTEKEQWNEIGREKAK